MDVKPVLDLKIVLDLKSVLDLKPVQDLKPVLDLKPGCLDFGLGGQSFGKVSVDINSVGPLISTGEFITRW